MSTTHTCPPLPPGPIAVQWGSSSSSPRPPTVGARNKPPLRTFGVHLLFEHPHSTHGSLGLHALHSDLAPSARRLKVGLPAPQLRSLPPVAHHRPPPWTARPLTPSLTWYRYGGEESTTGRGVQSDAHFVSLLLGAPALPPPPQPDGFERGADPGEPGPPGNHPRHRVRDVRGRDAGATSTRPTSPMVIRSVPPRSRGPSSPVHALSCPFCSTRARAV